MAADPHVRRIARELVDLRRRLATVENAPRLAHSSLEVTTDDGEATQTVTVPELVGTAQGAATGVTRVTEALAAARSELEQADAELTERIEDAEFDLTLAEGRIDQAEADITAATTAAGTATEKADAALVAAGQAQTAADAKPVLLYSSSEPSGTAPQGSTWYRVDASGAVLRVWQQTAAGVADTWTPRGIRSEAIDNLDVGKLSAGTASISTIVAQKIAAATASFQTVDVKNLFVTGTSTVSTQVAEMIYAAKIAARKILANEVIIGGASNMLPNGTGALGDNTGWGNLTLDTTDKPNGVDGAFRCAPGQTTIYLTLMSNGSPWVEVEPDTEYLVDVWLKADKPNSRFSFEIRDQNDALQPASSGGLTPSLAGGNYIVLSGLVPTVWTKYRAVMKTRPTASKVRVGNLQFNHVSGSERGAQVWVAATMRPRIDSALVVDGLITTDKLDANAINGMTITGATVRTAASGIRMLLGNTVSGTSPGIWMYDSADVFRWTTQIVGGVPATHFRDASATIRLALSEAGVRFYNGAGGQTMQISPSYVSVWNPTEDLPLMRIGTSNTANTSAGLWLYGSGASGHNLVFSIGPTSRTDEYMITLNGADTGHRLALLHRTADDPGLEIWGGAQSRGWARLDIMCTTDGPRFRSTATQSRTTTAGANVFVGSDGTLARSSSVKAGKLDVADQPMNAGLLEVPFRSWTDKQAQIDAVLGVAAVPERRTVGAIAEEVEKVAPELCTYDPDGRLTGVAYDRVGVALLPILRDLVNRVETLEGREPTAWPESPSYDDSALWDEVLSYGFADPVPIAPTVPPEPSGPPSNPDASAGLEEPPVPNPQEVPG